MTPRATLDIRPHFAAEGLQMWAHRGRSRRLVVCFSGIGIDRAPVQPYEFAQTATGAGRDNALFISDTGRSWLNAPGLIETVVREVEAMAQAVAANVICTLGHSMGGFAALVLPGFTRVDRAVAHAPQFSVHPDVAGDDPRWMGWRARILRHRIRSVDEHLTDATSYFVFHGRHGRETPQRDRFTPRENLVHMVLPHTVHGVPQRLKAHGLQAAVAESCFQDKRYRLHQLLAPLNAVRRSPGEAQVLPPSCEMAPAPAPEHRSSQETIDDQV